MIDVVAGEVNSPLVLPIIDVALAGELEGKEGGGGLGVIPAGPLTVVEVCEPLGGGRGGPGGSSAPILGPWRPCLPPDGTL